MAIETCNFSDSAIVWTDITNPTKEELEKVSKIYDLNPYTLIDSLDPDHLPKYEEHNKTHFFIVRILHQSHEHEQTIRELSSKIAVFLILILSLPYIERHSPLCRKYVKHVFRMEN